MTVTTDITVLMAFITFLLPFWSIASNINKIHDDLENIIQLMRENK